MGLSANTRKAVLFLVPLLASCGGGGGSEPPVGPFDGEASLQALSFDVRYMPGLDVVVFGIETAGDAASFVPTPAGQVDGAPVLGYVFPTTLQPADVGFDDVVTGTVALAVTSHPDFDDTPLWDENANRAYDDDGAVYHAHWVVLAPDSRAPAGLAVVQADVGSILPPTAPMPMYLDSPGFTVIEDGGWLRVVVSADRVRRNLAFDVGALVAFMRVDASGAQPLLAVHEVISQVGDGMPSTAVADAAFAPASAWPAPADDPSGLDVVGVGGAYDRDLDTFVLSMDLSGAAATNIPVPVGQVDGAPVLGYVFPTSIDPAEVGFKSVSGTLALAVTSHPDFDDTPLFDESLDRDYGNDGAVYHVHWVVLVDDAGSPEGLSVPSQQDASLLPPTAPMSMYLDSPGYHAFASGSRVTVLVPGWHLEGVESFAFDALTARMRVDASGAAPVLRVEEVVDVLSGDLSLPFNVSRN